MKCNCGKDCDGKMCRCKWGALIIVIVIVVGGIYCWHRYSGKGEQVQDVAKMEVTDVSVEANSDSDVQNTKDENGVYVDDNFGVSFEYPTDLTLKNGGLWTQETMDSECYKSPDIVGCLPALPQLAFNVQDDGGDLFYYILKDNNLDTSGAYGSPKEFTAGTNVPCEEVKIGDNTFTKVIAGDMTPTTTYYLQFGKAVMSFKVYWYDENKVVLDQLLDSVLASVRIK